MHDIYHASNQAAGGLYNKIESQAAGGLTKPIFVTLVTFKSFVRNRIVS